MKMEKVADMRAIATSTACDGLEIRDVEYSDPQKIIVVSGCFTENLKAHKLRTYVNSSGRVYFKFWNRRIFLDECLKTLKNSGKRKAE